MTTNAPIRRAKVTGRPQVGSTLAEQVARYLPSNYEVTVDDLDEVYIEGRDVAGWTLDGYVIPRLASGLYWATELDDAS